MSLVATNLKPLLTCPAFILWHLLGAVMCIPAILHPLSSPDPGTGSFVAAFVVPFWSGFVLTSLQRDLLLRPFSFCLPGHRGALRRTLFMVGAAASLVASLTVLAYPGLGAARASLILWSAFCFGMIVYLVVTWSVFWAESVATLPGLFMPVAFALVTFTEARVFVQEVALFSPGLNSVLLGILSVIAWRRLGSHDLSRRLCGRRFLSLQRVWTRAAAEELGAGRRRESLRNGTWVLRDWLGERCLARISRRPALSFRRHLAATQYELAGRLVPASPWGVSILVLIILAGLIAAGYAPPLAERPELPTANAAYVVSCLLAMNLMVPLFSTMLLPAGRRERFWGVLAIAGCNALLVLGLSLLLYLVLLGLSVVAPPLTFGGTALSFRPAVPTLVYYPLVLLPLSLCLKITCRRWLLVPEVILFGTALLILTKGGAPVSPSLTAVAVALAISWGVLLATVYARCFHGDLVRD